MKARKILVSLAALALVAAISIGGTLAYLTSTQSVKNTFTVGNVNITLTEAQVDENGDKVKDANGEEVRRESGNAYHLLPGHTYVKDPTVTVLKDSEACYVRALVTVNFSKELDEIFAPNGANLIDIFGNLGDGWSYYGNTKDETANTRTYEFRYKQGGSDIVAAVTADTKLPALFEKVTVPGTITNAQLAKLVKQNDDGTTTKFEITVVAQAIQADGFQPNGDKTAADVAWDNFPTT